MRGQVLLVEDDEDVAEVLSAILSELGLAVRRAGTVAGAMAALGRRERPDLVLVDYWLGGGNGSRVAHAAVEQGIPFCFLTADPGAADLIRRNGVPVLRKPFSIAALCAMMEPALPRGAPLGPFRTTGLAEYGPPSRPAEGLE